MSETSNYFIFTNNFVKIKPNKIKKIDTDTLGDKTTWTKSAEIIKHRSRSIHGTDTRVTSPRIKK